MKEVALATVAHVLLVDHHQFAVVESVEPLVPSDVLQGPSTVAREVEAQHAEMAVVLGARYRRRHGTPLVSPSANHVVVPGDERLPRMTFVLVRRIDPMRLADRARKVRLLLTGLLPFRTAAVFLLEIRHSEPPARVMSTE